MSSACESSIMNKLIVIVACAFHDRDTVLSVPLRLDDSVESRPFSGEFLPPGWGHISLALTDLLVELARWARWGLLRLLRHDHLVRTI
eukprot:g17280.t1